AALVMSAVTADKEDINVPVSIFCYRVEFRIMSRREVRGFCPLLFPNPTHRGKVAQHQVIAREVNSSRRGAPGKLSLHMARQSTHKIGAVPKWIQVVKDVRPVILDLSKQYVGQRLIVTKSLLSRPSPPQPFVITIRKERFRGMSKYRQEHMGSSIPVVKEHLPLSLKSRLVSNETR
ncbi:MAG: hypothetical protein J0J15_28200, partial [Mesorhizobium sp.]|nr:hypothetical protein [Mesorhizobium sp.]